MAGTLIILGMFDSVADAMAFALALIGATSGHLDVAHCGPGIAMRHRKCLDTTSICAAQYRDIPALRDGCVFIWELLFFRDRLI